MLNCGHEDTHANTYLDKGYPRCRTCARNRMAQVRKRKDDELARLSNDKRILTQRLELLASGIARDYDTQEITAMTNPRDPNGDEFLERLLSRLFERE
ncbi:hypothetical protein [Amycolatopsis methanolica]|uniref:hypothetical protein n=1 Tax=Amycolatopsis methanolica TaxID=1814 RepID=UPI00343FF2AE